MWFRLRIAPVAIIVFLASHRALVAQSSPGPAFEVTSVRSNRSNDPANSRFPLGPGDAFDPGSLFSATNQPLIVYLRFAYKLGQSDLLGLPSWVYNDRFDIEARAPGSPTKDQMRLMMRSLLAARFKVSSHTERRTRPVFNLVLAKARKTGPQLQPSSDGETCSAASPTASRLELPPIPCGSIGQISASAPDKGRLGGRDIKIAQIAAILTNPFTGVDRPVLDRTGLTGTFDFSLEWSLEHDSARPPDTIQPAAQPEDQGSSFLEALKEQLGFKLMSATSPVNVLTIDHVEHPDEN